MEEDQSNSSLCFQFDERDVETITKVKMGLGGVGVLTSILAIAIIAASKRFRRKFVYRLVGYLMFTALLESLAYILEEVPLDYSSNHIALRNETIFKLLCVGAGVYAQFAAWLENIVVCWIVVYLLLLAVCSYAPGSGQRGESCTAWEVCGVGISVIVAVSVCWIPLVRNMYGFAGAWCWIKLTEGDCHSGYTLGLIYQFTLYYGPQQVVIVFSLATFLLIVVVLCKQTVQGVRGCCQPSSYRTGLCEAFPLVLYAVVYDLMCILVAVNKIYYAIQIPHGVKPDYQLWLAIAVDDPLRALLPPVVFVLHWIIKIIRMKLAKVKERTTTYAVISNEDEDVGGDKEHIVIQSEHHNVYQYSVFEGVVD